MAKKPLHETKDEYLMGIDYGTTNIGLALGKAGAVGPLSVVPAKNLPSALNQIMRFAIENKVAKFVLGLPLDSEGKETKRSIEVRRFANRLKAVSKKPVDFQDEFATTVGAEEEMVDFEIAQKRRRTKDHYAAALILSRYYSANRK